MSLRVNTNVEAFNAHRNLEATQYALVEVDGEAVVRHAHQPRRRRRRRSGDLREDAGARSTALAQAQRNAMDGISLVQTAEGAYNEMHSILQRVRELSVQAQTARCRPPITAAIDTEVGQLTAELARI